MHKYWGFGLHILSEIEFPELLPADFEEADITISAGEVPQNLSGDGLIKKPFSQLTKDEYILNIKGVCRYYAGYGKNVIFEQAEESELLSVRLFLLGTIMAAILFQRGEIPMHASAIIKDGKLILFAGNSGVGKSTLLASLSNLGYEVFSDDVCVLKIDKDNTVTGTASYPMIKLWEDALDKLNVGEFNKDYKVRPQLPKFGQFFYQTFNKETIPLDKIFILSPQNTVGEVSIKQLESVAVFKQLEKQVYKFQLIGNTQLRAKQFGLLSKVASQAKVYEVLRPTRGSNVQLLTQEIEKYL